MRYDAFSTLVRATVFPEGEAANMVDVHKKYILDALIEIQQKVLCQRSGHRDNYRWDEVFFDNGASAFTCPRGFVQQLYTVLDSDRAARIDYSPVSEEEMIGLISDQNRCGTKYRASGWWLDDTNAYQYYEYYDGTKIHAGGEVDKPCRAQRGVFSLQNGQIYVYPQVQVGEIIVLKWDGIKRSWDDDEDSEFDREVQDAVELYLEAKCKRREDDDMEAAQAALTLYNDKIAHLAWQCREEQRLRPRTPYFSNCYPWAC